MSAVAPIVLALEQRDRAVKRLRKSILSHEPNDTGRRVTKPSHKDIPESVSGYCVRRVAGVKIVRGGPGAVPDGFFTNDPSPDAGAVLRLTGDEKIAARVSCKPCR